MNRLIHLTLVATVLLAACTSGSGDPRTAPGDPTTTSTSPTTTEAAPGPAPTSNPTSTSTTLAGSTTTAEAPREPTWVPLAAGEVEGDAVTDADLDLLASRYRVLVAQNLSPAQRDRLRELNPEILLIKYQASVSAPPALVESHPEWAVRGPSGDPVHSLNSTSLVMVNPSDVELRRARTAQATAAMTEEGFDGIMYDEAVIVRGDFYRGFDGIDPETGQTWTMEDFRAAQLENVRSIRAANPDGFIACNSVGNGTRYFEEIEWAHRFAQVCDALVAENYRGGSGDPAHVESEQEWLDDVEMGYDVDENGASLNAYVEIVTDRPGDETTRLRADLFQYGTFLLGYRDGALFSNSVQEPTPSQVGGNVNTLVFRDFQSIDPGEPVSERYEFIEGLYLRRFTNLVVVVNPTGDSIGVPLTESFVDWQGVEHTPETGLVLEPRSANLLLPLG